MSVQTAATGRELPSIDQDPAGGDLFAEKKEIETLERVVFIQQVGSAALWDSQGAGAARWTIDLDNARRIFLPETMQRHENIDASTDLLRRAVISEICVEEGSMNQFEHPIGVNIEGIQGSHFTQKGMPFSFIFAHAGKIKQQTAIYKGTGDDKILEYWAQEYPKWHKSNLESYAVLKFEEAGSFFVHQEHPAVHFLESKGQELGTMPVQAAGVEEKGSQWKSVIPDIFYRACNYLRKNYLDKASLTHDLLRLTVRFSRLDATEWCNVPATAFSNLDINENSTQEDILALKQAHAKKIVQIPRGIFLKLKIKYTLPSL